VRRRRRNKNRRGGEGRGQPPVVSTAREPEYVPPKSVFIYTHTVRPGAAGYEFRAEHFSKVGRTLDDYDIDLSSLFDAEGRIQLSRVNTSALADFDMGEDEEEGEILTLPPSLEQADVGEADNSSFDDTRNLPTRDIDGVPETPHIYGAEDTSSPSEEESDGPSLAVSE
jgi:hypothetical protein